MNTFFFNIAIVDAEKKKYLINIFGHRTVKCSFAQADSQSSFLIRYKPQYTLLTYVQTGLISSNKLISETSRRGRSSRGKSARVSARNEIN